jgi:prepilin-type N-terminal cleavage/methylation domain-containing protein
MNPRTSSDGAQFVIRPATADLRHSSFVIPRRGLTLVEMLVGLAITLVMMAAVVNLFANIGASVKIRRATMEMSAELRMMRATLFNDLAGATCRALPWVRPEEDQGYIEIVEGIREDIFPTALTLDPDTSQVPGSQIVGGTAALTDGSGLGDYDDILALTVRSENAPFKGRLPIWNNIAGQWTETTIESKLAEVIWYAVENPADGSLGEPGMRTVYRRVLLVAPWVSELPPAAGGVPAGKNILEDIDCYRLCDVSFRREGNLRIPNTLGDLTKRENRFAHRLDFTDTPLGWPFRIDQRAIRRPTYDPLNPPAYNLGPLRPFGSPFQLVSIVPNLPDRQGEDVMLSNVLAWDLRVFDPGAPLFAYQGQIIEPVGTNLFDNAIAANQLVGFGAYVDLGWDDNGGYTAATGAPQPLFQEERMVGWHPRAPNLYRGLTNPDVDYCVYDTWSFHYEHDGIDQDAGTDNGAGVDQGTNGLDDDVTGGGAANGVDDLLERETSPPYPVPLRGMQVKIRIYEPDTRQIREATVTRNFVPQ